VCVTEPVCQNKADIVLALDQSTSIVVEEWGGMQNWEREVLGFAKKITSAFPIDKTQTQFGVFKFNQGGEVAFDLNRYGDRESLENAIGKLEIRGGETNLAAALRTARDMFSPSRGSRPDVHKILILVTDGTANQERSNTLPEAKRTKEAGIKTYTVGITRKVDQDQLSKVASNPEYFFYAENFKELHKVLYDLIKKSCKDTGRLWSFQYCSRLRPVQLFYSLFTVFLEKGR